jgi:hypothetical protein
MKILFTSLLIFVCASLFGQGNLQFNRVITFSPGSTYTVPTGKVLKIESITFNGNSVTVPKTSTQTLNCPSICCGAFTLTVGVYAPVTFLSLGGINFSTSNVIGDCSWLMNPTPATTNTSVSLPQINCPLWLESGKSLSIYTGTFQMIISAIEFNIIL